MRSSNASRLWRSTSLTCQLWARFKFRPCRYDASNSKLENDILFFLLSFQIFQMPRNGATGLKYQHEIIPTKSIQLCMFFFFKSVKKKKTLFVKQFPAHHFFFVGVRSAGNGAAESSGSGENSVAHTKKTGRQLCSAEGERRRDRDASQERGGTHRNCTQVRFCFLELESLSFGCLQGPYHA